MVIVTEVKEIPLTHPVGQCASQVQNSTLLGCSPMTPLLVQPPWFCVSKLQFFATLLTKKFLSE